MRAANSNTSLALMLLSGASGLTLSHPASAQTGVSDDRVSLPSGPGSLEGLGENVGLDLNMGTLTYSVPLAVPDGFDGVSPDLSLSYSSGAGTSVLGMGWSLEHPAVERMTFRGLPRYDETDDFAGVGGEQLVRIPGTNPPVYRQRYERSFIRYTWKDAGSGGEGYWTAEYPDGRVGTFGATAAGALEDLGLQAQPALLGDRKREELGVLDDIERSIDGREAEEIQA